MARGDEPNVPGPAAIDLGQLREKPEGVQLSGERPTFYANDVQPWVETEGNVTLEFRHLAADGACDAVRVNLPAGLVLALTMATPKLVKAAAERYEHQAQGMRQFLQGAAESVGQVEETRRGGPPTDLSSHRRS